MIREAQISHSRHGYALAVVEVPLWVLVAQRAFEAVSGWTGDVLIGARDWPYKIGVGRRDECGQPRWNLGVLLADVGQWADNAVARRVRERLSMPVSVEWVAEHFPEQRIEFLRADAPG